MLKELEARYVMQTYRRAEINLVRGEGCYLFDDKGSRYLDMVAGVAVMTLGHSHPAWVSALSAQLKELVHVSNLFYSEPMVYLAEKLSQISGMDRVFYCNSGAEANECAIKIARKWGKVKKGQHCYKFVTFERGFHGRTLGALSATNNPKYGESFEPLVPGFFQLKATDCDQLQIMLDDSVCAVIVEPIQGEGGVWPMSAEQFQSLRKLCDERNVLLICDEVQTGIGRTGDWFAFQALGAKPDLMPLAKGLGGGFPIGACLASDSVAEVLVPGDHGSTFAGSPLAATAALAVIQTIEKEDLLTKVRDVGFYMKERLASLADKCSLVNSVRGTGLMLALELNTPHARRVVSEGLKAGLLLNATSDTTLRFIPPLIISKSQVDEAIEVLLKILQGIEP